MTQYIFCHCYLSQESPRAVAKVIESFNGVFEALSDEVGDFDDYEDEEFDVSNEGSEDMMLMKGGDSSNFMQMSKESDDKKKKTNKVWSRTYIHTMLWDFYHALTFISVWTILFATMLVKTQF